MMLIKIITQFLFLLLFALCVQSQTKAFKVNGYINTTEKDIIYLRYVVNGRNIVDSGRVINGDFTLSGELNEPIIGYLMIKKTTIIHSKQLHLFLEPSVMKIELNRSPFSIIKVEGSRSHREMTEFTARMGILNNHFNDILARAKNEKDMDKMKRLEDSVLSLSREIKQWEYTFFKRHPRSAVTSRFLLQSNQDYSIEELEEIYNGLGQRIKNTTDGRHILMLVNSKRSLLPGKQADDFSDIDFITGEPVRLTSLRGKYILVDFWGTWCMPCLELIPSLVQEYHRYTDKNIQFISISYDYRKDSAKVREIVQQKGMNWVNILTDKSLQNRENCLVDKYKIQIFPTTLIIGPDGKILLREEGTVGFIKAKRLLEQIL